jgi:ribosomal protein S18 acetylase RimI-like enzyme
MRHTISGPLYDQSDVCMPILRALPDWFGIEEALQQYEREINLLPTFVTLRDEQVSGFLSVKIHNQFAAEIYVMGVDPACQRIGIGHALIQHVEYWLHAQAVEYLQVKTLSASHPDPFYARTRAFYQSTGFRPLEEFKHLWDEENPCLVMIKRI